MDTYMDKREKPASITFNKWVLLAAILFNWITSIAFVLLFRYPIPFYGYIGPNSINGTVTFERAINSGSSAFGFYGLLGGFLLIGFMSFILAKIANRLTKEPPPNYWYILVVGLPALCWSLFLSTLDFIIGPW